MIFLIGFMWLFGQFSDKQKADTAYSYTQFVEAVEAGEVKSAKILQNKEVPTGSVVFTLENGEQKNTNLSDVNTAEALLSLDSITARPYLPWRLPAALTPLTAHIPPSITLILDMISPSRAKNYFLNAKSLKNQIKNKLTINNANE